LIFRYWIVDLFGQLNWFVNYIDKMKSILNCLVPTCISTEVFAQQIYKIKAKPLQLLTQVIN